MSKVVEMRGVARLDNTHSLYHGVGATRTSTILSIGAQRVGELPERVRRRVATVVVCIVVELTASTTGQ